MLGAFGVDVGSISGMLGTLWECWGRFNWMLGAFLGRWEHFGNVGNTLGMMGVLWVDVGSYFEVE